VGFIYTTLEHRVSHALVLVLVVNLGSYAKVFVFALEQALEQTQGVLCGHIPVLGFGPHHAFIAHLLLRSIVCLRQSQPNQLPHEVLDLVKVVTGERYSIRSYP